MEYTSAVLEYVRLDRKLYFATLRHESGQIAGFQSELEAATIAKDSLRELIRQHGQTHGNANAKSA